jgi:hypothetical protein
MTPASGDRILIRADEGEHAELGTLGVIWKIEGDAAAGRFAAVEHPIPPDRSRRRFTVIPGLCARFRLTHPMA